MEHDFHSRFSAGRAVRQVLAIAWTTVLEAIQQPVAFLILLSAVLTTLLVPVFQFHRFSEDGRLARDSGLSCMLVFGLVLAAGTAGRSVAEEIARGTAAAVIGKPVSRATFVLSKWLGVFLVVAIFWLGVLAATLAAERSSAHFLALESFTGYATDLVTLALSLLGVAAALATRLQTGAALAVCVLVLFLGLAGDSLALGAHALSWRRLAAGAMPNIQHFWLCDALAHGGRIAWSYVAEAAAYALTCCALYLAAGCLAFRERDLG